MEPTERMPKRIALLSEDAKLFDAISEYLSTKNLDVRRFADVDALAAGMGPASENVLVVDTRTLLRDRALSALMDDLDRICGGRPMLVCVAHSSEIDLRLQALRAGAEAFFLSPVAVDELAARLLDLSCAATSSNLRVLVVDDQAIASVFAARVLESAGMQVRIADDALRVLAVLEEFRPNLVLMDLHMPGADGIELTTLIREHDELGDTPVVFLSSELDTDKQMDALRVGGNDFIAKPVRPQRLIEVVRQGIDRHRKRIGQQKSRLEHNQITGLLSWSAFLRRLDASIVRGDEQGPGDGVLMIALGPPEAKTDPIAPVRVESIMEELTSRLRKSLGAGECAVRCGNMRLAVLARRETNDALFALAKVLRAELASVVSESSTPVYIGIGCFHPLADNALTLISRAEKACAQASEQDDGGIGVYQPLVPDGSDSERDVPLVALVEEALRCDGFHLVYQPIMTLRGEKGERYETSLRLRAPDGEYVSALDFLPAARRARLMPAVDRWVMEHALDRLEEEANGQRRLRLFVWQTMETLGSDEFIPWFRSQIVARDLIKGPPILQVSLDTLSDNREIGSIRFRELRRLAVKTCLNLSEEDLRVLDLIGELGIALVRIPLPDAGALDAPRLTQFIERLHEREVQVIVAGIEDPQAIARVFACGVDFVQGNFLQLPSEELCFDFGEAALD